MKLSTLALAVFIAASASLANAAELQIVSRPETTLIAVAPSSNQPSEYAAAFGKLVGYYALPDHTFQVVFPQMSISLEGKSYAAISVSGKPEPDGPVLVLNLPACQFVQEKYVGNYPGLVAKVQSLVSAAVQEGWTVAPQCGIRILHLNSPDDTPVEKLAHDIYVPITKRKPSQETPDN